MSRGIFWLRWIAKRGLPKGRGPRGEATELDATVMGRALELARLAAAEGEVPVGAVVYETGSGKVVGEGRNTRERSKDPCGHAELIAIRNACAARGDWRLNDCTLVVTLEPCAMCAGSIVNARVGRLVVGAMDPKAGCTGSLLRLTEDRRLNHRVRPIVGVMAEECSEILKAFFKERRNLKKEPDARASRS